ncbi:MAG: sulfatase-like hydrolase/transferase [Clostridia bacterium]
MDEQKIILNKSRDKSSVSNLIISAIIFFVTFALRSGIMTFVLAISGLILSIKIAVKLLKHNEISLLNLIAFAVSLFGSALFYLFFGINDAFYRTLNLLITLPSIAIFVAVLLVLKYNRFSKQKLCACVLCFALIASTLAYSLTMTLRIKPKVESLQKGHDEYLNSLKANANNNGAPNVLVVLMDDLGYSDISKYGYLSETNNIIQTPNIDSIGENGVIFDNFYSACPVCSPSRFGVLTGRYPARGYVDGVFFPSNNDNLNVFRMYNSVMSKKGVEGMLGDEITLAEVLNANGYKTGAFGKWHLGDYGEYLPTNQGFDTFYGSYYSNDMKPYSFYRDDKVDIPAKALNQNEITSILEKEVHGFIDSAVEKDEKFFAYYASPWPHFPVSSGENFKGTSDAGAYGDCIEEFDASLGRIIQQLKDEGVYDDTLIVFTSDNGPWQEGGNGGLRGRKNTVYEGGQKVPFMACYKNGFAAQAKSITSPAIGVDIFPTILSYCKVKNLPSDRIIDGISLAPLFDGAVSPDTHLHNEIYYINGGDVKAVQMQKAVDNNLIDFKYYDKVGTDNAAYFYQSHKNFLFNLDTDPLEAYNQSPTYADIAAEMLQKIEQMQKSLKENRRGKL